MNTINIPGFTATSSLGKSTISYRQFGSMNFRRLSSPIEPALMISNPFLVLLLRETGGLWGGAWGGGSDMDIKVPPDIDPIEDIRAKRACNKCLSGCGGTRRCRIKCEDQGLC